MSAELTPKNATIKVLEKASEDITYEEIMYEIHVLQKINRGLSDQQEGRKTTHEVVKEEFKKWME